jgi:hypothetical protein
LNLRVAQMTNIAIACLIVIVLVAGLFVADA